MSALSECHKVMTDGVGRCSVPMWRMGMPAGFCDEPAYGKQKPWRPRWPGDQDRPAYAEGLACRAHGGPDGPVRGTP